MRYTRRAKSMETNRGSEGILSEEMAGKRAEVVELLKAAYFMELETVMNYVTNSINPDGVRAQEVKESVEEDIQEELGHAQQFAARIKELYGVVPGSLEFKASQDTLQPPDDQVDVVHVIKGVIDAEEGAIQHYTRIVEETEEVDPVTQDMVIEILRDEQGHKRMFEGFLREYEAEGLA
jgi:bacterioferritin